MSTVIDNRVLEMQFDNKQFERGVSQSMSTLDKLKQKLNLSGTSKGLEEVGSAARKLNFSAMTNGLEVVGAKFSAMQVIGITALSNITNSAVNAGKRIASALTIEPIKSGFQEYETQIGSIQTILANTQKEGTNVAIVNKALDELNTYADKTIYNFTEMTRNIGTFTAAGVKLDTSVNAIKGIANLAAVSGSTSMQASTAMYQLSQALAAGKVQLMDWNSVVNAGMGGQVFQDALIRTSELLGTGAEAAIKASGSFRESLTKTGWLTTDVLTETLKQFAGAYSEADLIAQGFTEEQSKDIAKMAETAVNAATKVKTLTQLWDTLKEAAQSGWSQTWRLLVGDFNDAQELFTGISDTVGAMIGESSDSRNALLGGALNSNWDKLIAKINEAGVETTDFEEKLKGVLEAHNIDYDKIIEKHGSLEKAFQAGAVSTDILKEAVDGLGGSLTDLSSIEKNLQRGSQGDDVKKVQEALKNLKYDIGETGVDGIIGSRTEAAIKAFQEAQGLKVTGIVDEETIAALEKASESTVKLKGNIDKLIAGVTELGGREILIESFKNIFKALLDVVKPIGEAFRNIFPPMTSKNLLNMIKNFHSLTEKLKVGTETADAIRRTFEGVFSVFSIGVEAVKELAKGAISLISNLSGFGGAILSTIASIGDFLSNLRNSVIEGNIFGNVINNIVTFFASGISTIKEFGSSLKESISASETFQGVSGVFQGLWNVITKCASAIGVALKSIAETISEIFGKGDILEVINTGLFSGILLAIRNFVSGLSDPFEKISFLDNIKEVLDNVKGSLESWQQSIQANTLLKIAAAIGILAAALYVISGLNTEQITNGLVGIGGLIAELMGSLYLFTTFDLKSIKKVSSVIPLMIGLSIAILILVSAMKKLSTLKWEEIGKGLAGIGGLMAEIALFLNFAKFDGKAKSTATGILILSAAILVLSKAVKDFASMKWEEIGKGLAAIGGLLLELGAFTKLASGSKGIFSTGLGMIALAASLKILASVMKDFASMKWEEIGKGLAAIGGALLEIGIAMRLMPKSTAIIGVGLVITAAALKIIASAMGDFGGMQWGTIGKGLAAIGGSLLILAIGLNIMRGTLGGSAALLIAVTAIGLFVPVIKSLGSMNINSILTAMIALAGTFVVLGLGALALSPLIPAILGLAAALALIGVAALAFGAGVAMIAAGIASLAVSLAGGAAAIVAGINAVVVGLCELIPNIAEAIGKGIVEIAKIFGEYTPELADSLLKLVVGVLDSLATYAPQIIDSLAAFFIGVLNSLADHMPDFIVAATNFVGKLFEGIIEAFNKVSMDNLLKGVAAVGIITALTYALSGVLALVPAALAGVVGIGIVATALIAVLALLGGISQIPGLSWLIEEGGGLLAKIGTSLGKAIGGLIGGIGEGITGSLPQIGRNIADFMAKLATASENASGIKPGSFDGVSDLMSVMGTIGLTTVGTTLSDIFTFGGTSMDKFKTDGIAFFTAMKDISAAADGVTINEGAMTSIIGVATELSTLQSSLEPIGGVISWFTGRDDLGTFGTNVGSFISSMKTALESLEGTTFNTESLTSIVSASTELSSLQSSLEPIGGVISWFTGRDDLGTFGTNVGQFISSMSIALSGLDNVSINSEVLGSIISASTELSSLQSSLEPIGGVVDWFTGRDDLGTFGTNIGTFIGSMKTALADLNGVEINTEALGAIITASTELASLQSSLESVGGVVDWFTGRDDLGAFGTNIGTFIGSMKTAFSDLGNSTISEEALSSIITAATELASLQSSLENVGGVIDWFTGRDDLGTFGTNIGLFADAMGKLKTGMGEDGISESVITSVTNAGEAIIALQDALPTEGWFDGKMSLSTFSGYVTSFSNAMSTFSDMTNNLKIEGINIAILAANRVRNFIGALADLDTSGLSTFIGGAMSDGALVNIGQAVSRFSNTVADINVEAVNTAVSAAHKIKTLISGLVGLDTSGLENFKVDAVGAAMKSYSDKVAGINIEAVSSSVSSAGRLKSLISSLAGLDTSGIGKFKIASLGSSLKVYSSNISGFDAGAVTKSILSATIIKTFINSLSGINVSGVAIFKKAIDDLSTVELSGLVDAFSGASENMLSAGEKMMNGLASGIKSKTGVVKTSAISVLSATINEVKTTVPKFESAGKAFMTRMSGGITSTKGAVISAASSCMTSALNAVSGYYGRFFTMGVFAGSGLAAGIKSQIQSAANAAAQMAQAAVNAARENLKINSPSKVFKEIGSGVPEGFAMGIAMLGGSIKRSVSSMTDTTITSAQKAMLRVNDFLTSDLDTEPTIRPVLDLSDIKSGASALNGIFDSAQTVGVMANLGMINRSMNARGQNGTNMDVVSAIDKLRKDLGNISGTTYNVNGITYDDGSNVSEAIKSIVRAARIERRV